MGSLCGFCRTFFFSPSFIFFFFLFLLAKLRYTLRGKILLLLLHKLNDNGGLDFNVPSIVVERLVISVLYLKLEWFSVCMCVYRLCYKACMQLDIYTTIINETSAFVVIVLKNNSSFWYTYRYTFNKIWSLVFVISVKVYLHLVVFFHMEEPSQWFGNFSFLKEAWIPIYIYDHQTTTYMCLWSDLLKSCFCIFILVLLRVVGWEEYKKRDLNKRSLSWTQMLWSGNQVIGSLNLDIISKRAGPGVFIYLTVPVGKWS